MSDNEALHRNEPSPRRADLGTYNGYPVQYIGPIRFPDCRRPLCMNTCPHVPGRECIA